MCCRLELSNSKQTKAGKVMRRISGHMLILVYERIWNVKTRYVGLVSLKPGAWILNISATCSIQQNLPIAIFTAKNFYCKTLTCRLVPWRWFSRPTLPSSLRKCLWRLFARCPWARYTLARCLLKNCKKQWWLMRAVFQTCNAPTKTLLSTQAVKDMPMFFFNRQI